MLVHVYVLYFQWQPVSLWRVLYKQEIPEGEDFL